MSFGSLSLRITRIVTGVPGMLPFETSSTSSVTPGKAMTIVAVAVSQLAGFRASQIV